MSALPELPAARPELRDRLSVVLLTFNCAHRIDRILDRLQDLDVPIVAVDNGSGDATVARLRRRDGVQVVALPDNIGAAGRNAGADQVRTEYVAFCDDDGWYERDGLEAACAALDSNPDLGLINARILVGEQERLDPISIEMANSPVPDRHGLPGSVLLSFMAGAIVMRVSDYRAVGGYDRRFFIGGEEETLSFKLAKRGSQMRYLPDVVMHHEPSLANFTKLRAFGMRNTILNAWLHRPFSSALRWTVFTLVDTPKNRDYVRGLGKTLAGLPWVLRERAPMSRSLNQDLLMLDSRRFAARRPVLTTRGWAPPKEVAPSGLPQQVSSRSDDVLAPATRGR